MKFDLELENDIGCISISLNKDFAEGEIESIVKTMKSLLHTKLALTNDSVFALGDEYLYFELQFHNPQNKIVAIKALREALGCGLKDAKDMVDGTTRVPPLSAFNAKAVKACLERNGLGGAKDFSIKACKE